jgi:hypothetical protein
MKARRLSLGWELGELERAVDAARILCGLSGEGQFATLQDAERAPLAAAAVLALVGERLRLVRRVVHGWVPAQLLVAGHNEVHDTDAPLEDDDDVVLPLERKHVRSRADGVKRRH